MSKTRLTELRIIAFSKVPVHSNSNNIRLLQYRVYKKKRNLGISQEIDIVLRTKEFKIEQLSKLLHTRVHKAKFMHLFNDT